MSRPAGARHNPCFMRDFKDSLRLLFYSFTCLCDIMRGGAII
ncbi:hypothetical protein CLOBOL_03732 [Enterocloster bolteae ATCC BAA-613]|uniref:Uncharacterized protein n=1 Tax=Enterocloster bolteae (strain ATCC BAA-613 / DSM 15670 / CCUG 46953 / JCM 12243 / WAL 16351) TaxID=411902 RepID=A8RTN3_ENTBW|nr:hypothetical protein CLOBOL_03732 [Enterocloster bolteae ATCC BAA-613]